MFQCILKIPQPIYNQVDIQSVGKLHKVDQDISIQISKCKVINYSCIKYISVQVLLHCNIYYDHILTAEASSSTQDDTLAALLKLKGIFPVSKFEGQLPAIILKQQLYCSLKERTAVDQALVIKSSGISLIFSKLID